METSNHPRPRASTERPTAPAAEDARVSGSAEPDGEQEPADPSDASSDAAEDVPPGYQPL